MARVKICVKSPTPRDTKTPGFGFLLAKISDYLGTIRSVDPVDKHSLSLQGVYQRQPLEGGRETGMTLLRVSLVREPQKLTATARTKPEPE